MCESQRIYIKNLGPIRDLEFEVNRFSLVIGESAVGKSTLAKAIYLFKNFKSLIANYFISMLIQDHLITMDDFLDWLQNCLVASFEEIYGFELTANTYMRYEYSPDRYIVLDSNSDKPIFDISSIADKLYHLLEKQYEKFNLLQKQYAEELSDDGLYLTDGIFAGISEAFQDFQNVIYIPADRSIVINDHSGHALYNLDILDFLTQKYVNHIRRVRRYFNSVGRNSIMKHKSEALSHIWGEITDIIGGEYCHLDQRDFLLLNGYDSVVLPLASISSGQKDILWLLYHLYYLLSTDKDVYVIIEEPESHIFPSLQKRVMDIISFFANKGDNGVFVTTHSPYILLATNTLFYAGKFKTKLEEAEAIVGKDRTISEESLTAIRLTKQVAEDLIIPGEHELHTSYIDASDEIHSNYNKLVDLEDDDDDNSREI